MTNPFNICVLILFLNLIGATGLFAQAEIPLGTDAPPRYKDGTFAPENIRRICDARAEWHLKLRDKHLEDLKRISRHLADLFKMTPTAPEFPKAYVDAALSEIQYLLKEQPKFNFTDFPDNSSEAGKVGEKNVKNILEKVEKAVATLQGFQNKLQGPNGNSKMETLSKEEMQMVSDSWILCLRQYILFYSLPNAAISQLDKEWNKKEGKGNLEKITLTKGMKWTAAGGIGTVSENEDWLKTQDYYDQWAVSSETLIRNHIEPYLRSNIALGLGKPLPPEGRFARKLKRFPELPSSGFRCFGFSDTHYVCCWACWGRPWP
jgi:hypothetical protein